MANFYEVTKRDGSNVHINLDAIDSFTGATTEFTTIMPQGIELTTASLMSAMAAENTGVFGFTAPNTAEEVKE